MTVMMLVLMLTISASSLVGAMDNLAWIQANGVFCGTVCSSAGFNLAVKTNAAHSLGDFYVCAADFNGEGFRTGYQIQGFQGHQCGMGWGGDEVFQANMMCLCALEEPVWVVSSSQFCAPTCDIAGYNRAVLTDKPHSLGDFYVCAANFNNEGLRPGYQIQGFQNNQCGMGWGGREVFQANLQCLCDLNLPAVWVDSASVFCGDTCVAAGYNFAVKTDKAHSIGEFYVCAADFNNEGLRSGYQIQGFQGNQCGMGWGGQEVFQANLQCLCVDGNFAWIVAGGRTCLETCDTAGYNRAVKTNKRHSIGEFYVCAADFNNEGLRTGYQIIGFQNNQCGMGWGGEEVFSAAVQCLCSDCKSYSFCVKNHKG